MRVFEDLTIAELQAGYCNCLKTAQGCHGHFKKQMNKQKAEKYKEELIIRNAEVPRHPYEIGKFNGGGHF